MPVSRILLDNNVPIHLCRLLRPHEAVHAATLGWAILSNGELIRAARQYGFDVMITADQNIEHQQNLTGDPLAFVVLTTTHWPTIRENASLILAQLNQIAAGSFMRVDLPRPQLRRRPHDPASRS